MVRSCTLQGLLMLLNFSGRVLQAGVLATVLMRPDSLVCDDS